MRPSIWFILLLSFVSSLQAREEITVAAAADLVYCIQDLNVGFRKLRPEVDVTVSNGSSGTFFAQIRNGAPFDVYLSADMSFPRRLVDEGAADGKSLTLYAIGRIVLWSDRKDLDLKEGLMALKSAQITRIAIANPEHAPYGRAAKAAMEKAGIWNAVRSKIVYGENILQTKQYVQTGNAEVGIIALSLVKAPVMEGVGQYVLISGDSHPRLEQGAVLTRQGAENPAARAYMEFLRTGEAREIFERYGFVLPK